MRKGVRAFVCVCALENDRNSEEFRRVVILIRLVFTVFRIGLN